MRGPVSQKIEVVMNLAKRSQGWRRNVFAPRYLNAFTFQACQGFVVGYSFERHFWHLDCVFQCCKLLGAFVFNVFAHMLEELLKKLHYVSSVCKCLFNVDGHELAQMPARVRLLCPEEGPDLENSL